MRALIIAALAGAAALAQPAFALDKVTFATNWLADPEAGGYYQALADGTYEKYGLDVTILPGGPTLERRHAAHRRQDRVLHGRRHDRRLPRRPEQHPARSPSPPTSRRTRSASCRIRASASTSGRTCPTRNPPSSAPARSTRSGPGCALAYGFKDENIKPYNFNSAPFIVDTHSIQQGYITSEPYEVEKQGHFKPNVFLLADYGYTTYSTEIITRREIVEKNPDMVQRFVNASAIGWYNYLYHDNAKANALIKQENPEMTDEQIAFSIAKMKEYGIVDSGDTLTKGIGAMTDERWKDFYDKMVKAGVVKAGIDYKKAYTLQFVNKGVGLDLRPKDLPAPK